MGENSTVHYDPNSDIADHALKKHKMSLDAGWLGKLFGAAQNAPSNIAGLALLILLVAGIIVPLINGVIYAEFWKIIAPIITMILGYLFGKFQKG